MLSVGDRSCIKTVLKMTICFPIRTYTNSVLRHSRVLEKQMSCNMCRVVSQAPSSSCCLIFNTANSIKKYSRISLSYTPSRTSNFSFRAFQRGCSRFWVSTKRGHDPSLTVKSFVSSAGSKKTLINFSSGCKNASVRMLLPERRWPYNVKCKFGPFGFSQASVSAGLISGLLVCYASSDSAYAEVPHGKGKKEDDGPSSGHMAHGKKVYTDYSVIGIPGDGRCLFRSVAYGACLRSGRAAPSESLQRQLADELRAMVADEFVRRQEETEWFIEGDFDSYVSQIRKPHVWGGEPELLMLSHVLRMPITVYMRDEKAGGLISIAEYGQEYDKENPIGVLYHGFGHYDALLIPGKKGAKSRL